MDWIPIEEAPFEGADSYFQWRLGEGDENRGLDLMRPAIVGLKRGMTAQDFAAAVEGAARVPTFYTSPIEGLGDTRWCTVFANDAFFRSLETEPELSKKISRITVQQAAPFVPRSPGSEWITESSYPPHGDSKPGAVVMGVIDYGIAFAHERFRLNGKTTRIEYLWVQDAPHRQLVASGGLEFDEAPPRETPAEGSMSSQAVVSAVVESVPYGRELTANTIDGWLSAEAGAVDEDRLYRKAAGDLGQPWLRSISARGAHGTSVMDLASGYDPSDESTAEEREQRRFVCVQLPEATTADTSGSNLDAFVLDGIRYILEQADAIARKRGSSRLPVVINLSFGDVAGPHDGTSSLEVAIDELIEARPGLDVVIPSGNSHLGRLHAQVMFHRKVAAAPNVGETVQATPASVVSQAAQTAEAAGYGQKKPNRCERLRWRVLPDDRTASFMEIWLPGPPQEAASVSLTITAPGESPESPPLTDTTDGAGLQLTSRDGVVCEARYRHIRGPTNRGMFLIALQPTRRFEQERPIAPAGTWMVRLTDVDVDDNDPIEVWIQRDDTPYGFPLRGRQSYFDQRCYQRYDHGGREIELDDPDCVLKRAGSTNAIATGRRTVVVGGFVRKTGAPAKYSAGGPVTGIHRVGPDVMAVSDDSPVRRGVLAAGTRSGSVVRLNGTSVAAPQIARRLADERAKERRGGRESVMKVARIVENDPAAGISARRGAGRIPMPPIVRVPRSEDEPATA